MEDEKGQDRELTPEEAAEFNAWLQAQVRQMFGPVMDEVSELVRLTEADKEGGR